MPSRSDAAVITPAVLMPDATRVSFLGSLSITKTTLTVSKNASRRGESPLFIGVCSIPLIQFYREKQTITFMRGSAYLFDDAALSAGLGSYSAPPSSTLRSNGHASAAATATLDNPTAWKTLTVRLDSPHTCERTAEALLSRHAEEVFTPPFPIGEVPEPPTMAPSATHSISSRANHPHEDGQESVESYHRHNEFRASRGKENASPPTHNRVDSKHSDLATHSSQRPASSHISDRGERQDSEVRRNTRVPTARASSDTASITTRSSRLPQRRDDEDVTSARSSRQLSHREQDATAPSSARYTPSETIRSSHRIASRRHEIEVTPASAAPTAATATAATNPTASHAAPPRSTSASRRRERRQVDPIEREFHETGRSHERRTRTSSRHHHRSRSPGTAADPAKASSHVSSRRTRSEGSGQHGHRHHHHHDHHESGSAAVSRNSEAHVAYSNSITPRSVTLSSRQRSEQEQFFRTVQKVQHHRLHFIMYLHKEMVHQAYLAEEAKLRAATAVAAAAGRPSSRHRSLSSRRVGSSRRGERATQESSRRDGTPRSARARGSIVAEESARLQAMEARMAEVETVHREAERERDAAARLRREFEWKLEELHRTGGVVRVPSAISHGAHSHDASVFTSPTPSPHRRGTVHSGAHVMHPSENGTAGAAGALMLYKGTVGVGEPQTDRGISIVDRYVFGDEWFRIFPSREADIRFNAQIDLCLALRMPRERVTVTNLVVDQPGLRVTAEIAHDHNHTSRKTIERRVNGSPFRFLQRMYEMRDLFDPRGGVGGAGAIAGGTGGGSPLYALRSSSFSQPHSQHHQQHPYSTTRRTSAGSGTLVSLNSGGGYPRPVPHPSARYPGASGSYGEGEGDGTEGSRADVEARRRELHDRQEARARKAGERLERRQRDLARDLRRQLRDLLEQLEDEEENSRRRVGLVEAKARQEMMGRARRHQRASLAGAVAALEEAEAVARATVEVGAARQFQVLVGGHRRRAQLATLVDGEHQRRRAVVEQEGLARESLHATMHPLSSPHARLAERREAERQRLTQQRERESRTRQLAQERLVEHRAAERREALYDLVADERAARAALMTDAMTAWLEVLCAAPRGDRGFRRLPSIDPRATARLMLRELVDTEAADRATILEEEARRRRLYARERVLAGESSHRHCVEGDELAARGVILDAMVQHNRAALERRLHEREQMATLVGEETFYRSTIVSDEQDAFEVLAELFAEGLRDLLNRVAEVEPEDDLPTPRRRQFGARQAKPFHYMTFSPEDMDFAPSAVLAIEGILGCGINKNLEVTSISRPLPKAEEDSLQFQAGDMILDAAGHSLHSLSHLREVLSTRTMQIQREALEEFPDVPEDQRTTSPALQKYIEVLCEHHNFLVQVLRGCDIFQIIVKS